MHAPPSCPPSHGPSPLARTVQILIWTLLCFAAAGPLVAEEAAPSPEAWVDTVRAEAEAFRRLERDDPELARLTVGCGAATMATWHEQEDFPEPVRDEARAFVAFMKGPGKRLLATWLADGRVPPDEARYATLIKAAYLHDGYYLFKKKPYPHPGRILGLGLDREQQQACLNAYARALDDGKRAMIKGYLEQRLTAADVEAIRLYKLADGMQRIAHVRYLPFRYGLHPYAVGQTNRKAGAPQMLGRPLRDLKLPRLEAILHRPAYTDHLDVQYNVSWYVRPEGILEYLLPLTGYEPVETPDGPACRVKQRLIDLAPGEKAADWFRIADAADGKPLVLVVGSPLDRGPMGVGYPLSEVLHRAYGDRVGMVFVGVNLGDVFGGHDFFTPEVAPFYHDHTHPWSVEERARRLKNWCLSHPAATFPHCVDTMEQTAVEAYMASGGCIRHILIGPDGRVAAYVWRNFEMFDGINELERAIRRMLRGEAPPDGGAYRFRYITASPPRQTGRLQGCRIETVDASARTLRVACPFASGKAVLTVRADQRCRVTDRGTPADLACLTAGQTVDVTLPLDAWLPGERVDIDPNEQYHQRKTATVERGGRRLVLGIERPGCSGNPRRFIVVYRMQDDTRPPPSVTAARLDKAWTTRPRVWLCGTVERVDAASGAVTVRRLPAPANGYAGVRLLRAARKAGAEPQLSDAAAARLAVARQWADNADGGRYTFALDTAVDVVVNGAFVREAPAMEPGDFVGVCYTAEQQGREVIYPEAIRVTRPVDGDGRAAQ
jgi:hypothetical protein